MKLAFAVLSLLLCALPAHASTLITSVEVGVGSTYWCNVGNAAPDCAGALTPWNLGSGIPLDPGDSLVLTQTSGFNFDTSDACPLSGGGCLPPKVTVNGVAFSDSAFVLAGQALGVVDPVTAEFMEAHDWLALPPDSGLRVAVAYADNAHLDRPCSDADANCHPESPWKDATFFIGHGTAGDIGSGCGRYCFDAGAVYIGVVPEPATVLLFSAGLILLGVILHRRRHV